MKLKELIDELHEIRFGLLDELPRNEPNDTFYSLEALEGKLKEEGIE